MRTILLIGAKEPYLWDVVKKVGNTRTKKKTHLINGQKKTTEEIAIKLSARSFFPFEAPFQPFVDWAEKCSTMRSFPIQLLVHEERGLFISFRGSLCIN